MQEIANSFYIKKLYTQHKKLKFVLVASEGSLADKGTLFVSILQQFCNSFKNVDLVKNSVILVITGVKAGKKIEHLKNTLTRIHTENESLSVEARNMLGYLIDKIAIFYAPAQEGLLPAYDMFGSINTMGNFVYAGLLYRLKFKSFSKSH